VNAYPIGSGTNAYQIQSSSPAKAAMTAEDSQFRRHCERSEAIQNLRVALDCFAALAMTKAYLMNAGP
jgi:hypothetical protein